MQAKINSTESKIQFSFGNDVSVGSILEKQGYKHVNSLDIENYKGIEWEGIEFNRIYTKDGILYRFSNWVGEYPYKVIEIEEIGELQ